MKPQEEVPTEVIIHYIVKDYQRMFLAFDEMKTRAEKAEAEILEMKEIHHKQIENRVKEIDNLRKEDKDRTNKLEEQLAAIQYQNRLLAHAVISNNSKENGSVLFKGMVPADAMELEKKIGIQLSEALLKLTAAVEKLTYFQEKLENDELPDIEAANMDYFLSKVARTFNKIEASTQHIENFYKLVNGIPIL
jgi:hypothetical protein